MAKRNHEGCERGYIRTSKAWYSKSLPNQNPIINIGMYHPDGGTSGEFVFVWIPLNNKLCAQLKSFEDSWSALSMFQDLLQKMSEIDSECIQEPEFCKILDSLGIKDITEYIQP